MFPAIFEIPKDQVIPGVCFVCGATTELRYADAALARAVGQCCIEDLIHADAALSTLHIKVSSEVFSNAKGTGLRRPTQVELSQMEERHS
jgi:hypothetical protein